jgi:alcohol dehydrogenase (cytochrome c)
MVRERANGQTVLAKPYTEVNSTKGIDQKTGKPLDYDPGKDIQTCAGVGNVAPGEPLKRVCPSQAGGNNYWPSSYSSRRSFCTSRRCRTASPSRSTARGTAGSQSFRQKRP